MHDDDISEGPEQIGPVSLLHIHPETGKERMAEA